MKAALRTPVTDVLVDAILTTLSACPLRIIAYTTRVQSLWSYMASRTIFQDSAQRVRIIVQHKISAIILSWIFTTNRGEFLTSIQLISTFWLIKGQRSEDVATYQICQSEQFIFNLNYALNGHEYTNSKKSWILINNILEAITGETPLVHIWSFGTLSNTKYIQFWGHMCKILVNWYGITHIVNKPEQKGGFSIQVVTNTGCTVLQHLHCITQSHNFGVAIRGVHSY